MRTNRQRAEFHRQRFSPPSHAVRPACQRTIRARQDEAPAKLRTPVDTEIRLQSQERPRREKEEALRRRRRWRAIGIVASRLENAVLLAQACRIEARRVR